tara:strand:+ start:9690 stop:10193 length:504 start_codon:yes stop_codon:yes gene_type:complete
MASNQLPNNNTTRNPNIAPNNGNRVNNATKPNGNRVNNATGNRNNGNSATARARGKSLAEQAQSQGYAMAQKAHEQALNMVQQAQMQALEKAKQVAISRGLQFNANVPTNYLDTQGRRIMQGANGGTYVNTSNGRNYKPTPAFLNQMGTNVVSQISGNLPPNNNIPK